MAENLLAAAVADEVVETCRGVAGDSLRSVTYFTDADYRQLYLRADLARDADLESFTGVEWHESTIIDGAYATSELGEHQYTIRAFENGYLLRVSSELHGLFVTTDDLPMRTFERLGETLDGLLTELSTSAEIE
jgi:hypothetical protein